MNCYIVLLRDDTRTKHMSEEIRIHSSDPFRRADSGRFFTLSRPTYVPLSVKKLLFKWLKNVKIICSFPLATGPFCGNGS